MIVIMDSIICAFTASLLKSKTSEAGSTSMRQIYMGALFSMLAFIVGNLIK